MNAVTDDEWPMAASGSLPSSCQSRRQTHSRQWATSCDAHTDAQAHTKQGACLVGSGRVGSMLCIGGCIGDNALENGETAASELGRFSGSTSTLSSHTKSIQNLAPTKTGIKFVEE